MSGIKRAQPDHPIDDLIAARWSPYVFDGRSVSEADLRALFEAARWAPSSYNEQPWRYIVASRDHPGEFNDLLSCLGDANQTWAKHASALALGVAKLRFDHNDKPNRVAYHDLGLASANLTLEATKRGLSVHQMAGIVPERAVQIYRVPEGFEVATALAIGYPGDASASDELGKRDLKARSRNPLSAFVYSRGWGRPAWQSR